MPYKSFEEVEVATLKQFHTSSLGRNEQFTNMTIEWRRQEYIVSYTGTLNDVIIQHNTHFCDTVPNRTYIIYVCTAIRNMLQRMFIHETWGNNNVWKGGRSRTVFIVGKSLYERDQLIIDKEFKEHGDIVHIDSYHNLILKQFVALKWITTYFTNAQFVIKADDDVVPNIFQIYRVIKNQVLVSRKEDKCYVHSCTKA